MAPIVLFGHRVTQDVEFYGIGVVFLIIGIALARNIINSPFGRAVRASGSDALAAEVLGVPTARVRLSLFVIGAMYASVAGSLYAPFLRVITPANFDVVTAINMVLMLFLGGKETLWGSVLGVTILRLLPELAEGLNDYKTLIQGVLFVAVLMFFPRGLAGLLLLQFHKIGRRGEFADRDRPRDLKASSVAEAITPHRVDGFPNLVALDLTAVDGAILRIDGLSKMFGGVAALSDVSFDLRAGQLKAVIGPNGAGKTTLFNLLTGVLQPNSGSIALYGRSISISRPHRIARQSVARTFQTPRLFANMTVLERTCRASHQATRRPLQCGLSDARGPHRRKKCRAKCGALAEAARHRASGARECRISRFRTAAAAGDCTMHCNGAKDTASR